MNQKHLYIIAGPNGAGKTTASFEILPHLLDCKEFVNADEIAKGLSPFNPESVSFEAGRIMLNRINELLYSEEDFAFETTLSTRSFISYIKKAEILGFTTNLIFFYLDSAELAKKRVAKRVKNGGHNIPEDTIVRRYFKGLKNLMTIYFEACDVLYVFDNSENETLTPIFTKFKGQKLIVLDHLKLNELNSKL